MHRALFFTFLVATGCLPTIDVDPPRVCEVLGIRPVPKIIPRDTTSTIEVPLIADDCLPDGVTATVEVFDSANEPVLFQSNVETSGRSSIARVTVLPRRIGELHVIVVFEPELGRTSRATLVVEPARAEVFSPEIDGPCTRETLTANGTWVCQLVNTITVWREGMLLQTLPALGLAGDANAVWLLSPDGLERWVDSGLDFLQRVPDVKLPAVDADVLLAEGDDALWSVRKGVVTRLRLDGAALLREREFQLPRGLCAMGPRYAVSGDALTVACPSREAHTRLCRFPSIEASRCVELDGSLVSVDRDQVWLSRSGTIVFAGLDAPEQSLALPPGFTLESRTPYYLRDSWPVVSDATETHLLVRAQGDVGLSLELAPLMLELRGHGAEGLIVGRGTERALLK
ncbi:MAG: hypothetical protein JNM17_19720 [Archangium sp.]|nr:hypothetical protein [Archangium sp.]